MSQSSRRLILSQNESQVTLFRNKLERVTTLDRLHAWYDVLFLLRFLSTPDSTQYTTDSYFQGIRRIRLPGDWEASSSLLVPRERPRGGCRRFGESSCLRCPRMASLTPTDPASESMEHQWFSVVQYIVSVA